MSDRTIVTFLLDRSGSMQACWDATIEAFNGYLGGLQEEPDGIDFTLLTFDSQSLDKICVATPVRQARGINRQNYVPRGGTPLIDASVKTIRAVEKSVNGSDKVVICIQTDGQENESTEHTLEELRALIKAKTEAGWQFNFMGAGVDAYSQASQMGIAMASAMSYDHANAESTKNAFVAASANTRAFASGRSLNTNFSAEQRISAGDRFAPPPYPDAVPVSIPSAKVSPSVQAAAFDLTKQQRTATPSVQGSHARRQMVSDFALDR